MEFIQGENRDQVMLLPNCVEDYVDECSPVRVLDAYIDRLDMVELGFDRAQPNGTGRPMYAATTLLKLYLYGYLNRIRSSRRLETETKRNLEVIWLLDGLSPDHKTIARFRHDNPDALEQTFRHFVRFCTTLNLFGKELEAVDGCKFKASNSKSKSFTRDKLIERLTRIDKTLKQYLQMLDEVDLDEDCVETEKTPEEIREIIKSLDTRKETYEGYKDELERTGQNQLSLTDPDSRLMMSHGSVDVCYNVQTVVDAKNKLVAEFEVTNQAFDVNLLGSMRDKAKETLGAEKLAVVADAGYDSVEDIVHCLNDGVHIAKTNFDLCLPADADEATEVTAHKNGRCIYIPERNIVLCPMGKALHPKFYKDASGHGVFHNSNACKHCTCKCTREARGRRFEVPMDKDDFSLAYDDKDLYVKQIRIAPDKAIIDQRKCIVEHPFGIVKRSMDCSYCLTRGLRGVTGEFALTFLAFNFKRVINILGVELLLDILA